jgi:hypothetical protein
MHKTASLVDMEAWACVLGGPDPVDGCLRDSGPTSGETTIDTGQSSLPEELPWGLETVELPNTAEAVADMPTRPNRRTCHTPAVETIPCHSLTRPPPAPLPTSAIPP